MHIDRVVIFPVVLPFRMAFPHALSQGASAANVIIAVEADGGQFHGYGEGAPRSFVTGETQATVCDQIARWAGQADFPWDIDTVDTIWRWVDSRGEQRGHNAALCAVETALLDALAKARSTSVAAFFPPTHSQPSVTYGAAVPLGSPDTLRRFCQVIAQMGVTRVKLKWARDLSQNRVSAEAVISAMGPELDLKVDVNGAWDGPLALAHLDLIGRLGIKAVEQPLVPGATDIAVLAGRLKAAGVRLMADESVCTLAEAMAACGPMGYNMVNIRLSKCGGMRRCWQLIDYLRCQTTAFQIGCQLGESGILSAAGRTLSLLCADALYHDGSYDSFLLKDNPAEDVTFGPGGSAGPLPGSGLGVAVDADRLAALSVPALRRTVRRP